jgi:hypothetical protein
MCKMVHRWSDEKANEWYAQQPWLMGCDFIPSSAINQLEMWQAETFDPVTIDRELGWAAGIGFNTVRTYLHDLTWEANPEGFKRRIEQFINISSRHGIRPILVFFDDCWNPNPRSGTQPAPKPGVHNSGWVQSPGLAVVNAGQSAWGRLERYIKDVIGTFADDERILFWDLYNEPGNSGNSVKTMPLLEAVFEWARSAQPTQPLTAGVWTRNKKLNEFQLSISDIITFHNYSTAKNLERQIIELKKIGRPLICTEWMARTRGSLVRTNLPVFVREKVGCLNWGLVAGKTNTIYPWRTPLDDLNPMTENKNVEPKLWFHDLFHPDGAPYDLREIELFKKYQGVS